ncbi:MAG: pseudaminic acid synthase [Flavobacterium sp.]|nr:pseudaminic acid synthase [Flavobacterium sp.]
MNEFSIGDRKIGKKSSPFIIAEMSGNHNQSLDRALQIVEAAAKAGAHAIKLQTYTADTITLDVHDGDFEIKDTLWAGTSLHKLYQQAYTPWEWHKPIFELCAKLGIIAFSTPFDETAVDFLETLNVPCYKIASFELVHLPLIKKVAQTGKPIIMSTGMATISEIEDAVSIARNNGCKDLVLLKCNSGYPSTPEEANLATIPHMQELFNCPVGLSDHSMGIGIAIASVALGAVVIEKHFTLARTDGGPDAQFSLEPEELKNLVLETERAWQAIGTVNYQTTKHEESSKAFRRSLYVSQNIKAGDKLTAQNVKIVRPGYGLSPKFIDKILGKVISQDIKKGTALTWEIFNDQIQETK